MESQTEDVRYLISEVRRYYGEGCFACGRDNPHGLGMDFFRFVDGSAMAEFLPRPEHRGTEGILHGGVVTTTLDEISVWAAILTHHTMVVTGRLEVKFHRPTPVGDTPLSLRGWVKKRRGNRLVIAARLLSGSRVCADSEGLFLATHTLEEMGIRVPDAPAEGDPTSCEQ